MHKALGSMLILFGFLTLGLGIAPSAGLFSITSPTLTPTVSGAGQVLLSWTAGGGGGTAASSTSGLTTVGPTISLPSGSTITITTQASPGYQIMSLCFGSSVTTVSNCYLQVPTLSYNLLQTTVLVACFAIIGSITCAVAPTTPITLTLTTAGSSSGQLCASYSTPSGSGNQCSVGSSTSFPITTGQVVNFVASPPSGWTTQSICVSNSCSSYGSNTYTYTVTSSVTAIATFTNTSPVTLTVTVVCPQGSYVSCGGVSNQGQWTYGQTATVSATPSSGFAFSTFCDNSNGVCTSSNPYNFVITRNTALTATFVCSAQCQTTSTTGTTSTSTTTTTTSTSTTTTSGAGCVGGGFICQNQMLFILAGLSLILSGFAVLAVGGRVEGEV